MQVVKGDGGMDLSEYFKIVKIVMFVKTRDFVPTLTKAPLQLVSKLPIKKQGGALKL